MKMKTQPVTFQELQQVYGKPSIRPDDAGFYLRKVGESGKTLNPNIQLHVSEMSLPIERGTPINLIRGFLMPQIVELLNLRHLPATVLFVQFLSTKSENFGYKNETVCHLRLSDPEDSDAILLVTNCGDIDINDLKNYNHYSLFHRVTQRWEKKGGTYGSYVDQCLYEVFPLGFRNTGDGTAQSAADVESTRLQMIELANEYLGIAAEKSQPEVPEISAVPNETLKDHTETRLPTIPGVEFEARELCGWFYSDDSSGSYMFVIDRAGRIINHNPERTVDYSWLFVQTKYAEYRFWTIVPKGALILSWRKESVSSPHEFHIVEQPETITLAQYERSIWLRDDIDGHYKDKEPFDNSREITESPDVGKGWNIQRPRI